MISFADRARRFSEVAAGDIQETAAFLVKFDASNAELLDRIRGEVDDSRKTWITEMGRMVTSTRDEAWLQFLEEEMKISGRQIVDSIERWLGEDRRQTVAKNKLEDCRSGETAYKRFVSGPLTAERLEVLIAERNAVKARTLLDLLHKKETTNQQILMQTKECLPRTLGLCTRVFERAIQ